MELYAYYANIPTVTSLGMAELLPKGDEELAISVSGKKWDIRHPAVDGNLLEKSVRKELIEKQYNDVHFGENAERSFICRQDRTSVLIWCFIFG